MFPDWSFSNILLTLTMYCLKIFGDILLPSDEIMVLSLIFILILPFLYCVPRSFKHMFAFPSLWLYWNYSLQILLFHGEIEILHHQLPALPTSSETLSVCLCHLYTHMCYFLFYHNRLSAPPGKYSTIYCWTLSNW